MKWVHPNLLFALAVLLIPLLIHLFHFRKYKTVYFSSLTFIKNIEQEQKNPRKLRHFIILLLRMLAFSFLVIAFAQPYIPDAQEENKSKVIGIYLDNSYSMSRIGENGELLNQGKQIIESYVDKAPVNTQYVLITNELDGNEKQLLNGRKLKDKLEKITYSPLTRNQKEIVQFWKETTQLNTESDSPNSLVYLSDFQKRNFTNQRIPAGNKDILYPVLLKPVNPGNLFIDTCWFDSPVQRLGERQRIGIRVQNSGETDQQNVIVNVRIGKMNRDLYANIRANQSDTVYLDYFNQEAGDVKGSIRVNDQQMTQDDAFYFHYVTKSFSNLLIINGEDAVPNVRIVFEQDAFYHIQEVSDKNYDQESFSAYDLIVLNGLNQVSAGLSKNLEEHAENKGTLFLIPGTNSSQSGWNQLLGSLHLPVISGTETVGLSIQKINLEDRFFQGVFEKKPTKLGLPLVSKSYRLEPTASTEAANLLNYQNGSPFFVRGNGNFRAYVLATSLKPDFSSFTSNQLFSTLLLHVAALSQKQSPLFITLGADSYYPIEKTIDTDRPLHLKNEQTDFIPLVFTRNGRSMLSVKGNEALSLLQPGIFKITEDKKDLGYLAVNANRLESDITPADETYCLELFRQNGFQVSELKDGSTWKGGGLIDTGSGSSYWKLFIILALTALLGEMVVIMYFKR